MDMLGTPEDLTLTKLAGVAWKGHIPRTCEFCAGLPPRDRFALGLAVALEQLRFMMRTHGLHFVHCLAYPAVE